MNTVFFILFACANVISFISICKQMSKDDSFKHFIFIMSNIMTLVCSVILLIGLFAIHHSKKAPEAIDVYFENKMLYGPAKAANAGGVATSGLEMSQNSERLSWTFEEVDGKLHGIMKEIFKSCDEAAKEFGMEGNYMAGANIAGS